jgi:hypothetical protein
VLKSKGELTRILTPEDDTIRGAKAVLRQHYRDPKGGGFVQMSTAVGMEEDVIPPLSSEQEGWE